MKQPIFLSFFGGCMETEIKLTGAVLCALSENTSDDGLDASLDELERLLDTAGGQCVARMVQYRDKPDVRTYFGKGKIEELADFIRKDGPVELVVFNTELSQSQIANIGVEVGVRVIDRTMLILDIFAKNAVTAEGKLQVEIACLRYSAPRLVGHGKDMSRLGGGIGTRGPGESKLESDRRHLNRRIAALQAQLDELESNRTVQHSARRKSNIKTAAIVGYTNAGKSTLLNYLTGAGILAEDKLFATLDPTTRRLKLPDGQDMLLTDTVGFIDRLPTHLVKAFKSTLDELKYADIIIEVTDASECEDERRRKRAVTESLIDELGGGGKPLVLVYNKCDQETDSDFIPPEAVRISAKSGDNIDGFLETLNGIVNAGRRRVWLKFPHSRAGELNNLYKNASVLETDYTDDGVRVFVECGSDIYGKYADFAEL